MSTWATMICDGCATEILDVALGGRDAARRLENVARQQRWATPLIGVWLCPACAEVTQIAPDEVVTEAMW